MTSVQAARTRIDLARVFRGPLHRPGDADYDAQRAAWRPGVDSRPAIVAEATGPDDVRAAVEWAVQNDEDLAVQATGHGTVRELDGGLLLKTGRMAGVLVDPDRRVARAGPGARWSDVIAAAAPFGLAPLSGSSPNVGVAGYTLGGGVGWLSRKYGYAADSLLRVDLVTAGGRALTVTADRHPDLFWALRGGSGNFGLVTSLEFRLHPVSRVYAGVAYFPIERAADILGAYADTAAGQPHELTTAVVVGRTFRDPEVTGPAVAVRAVHLGDPATARRDLGPLWRAGGRPLAERMQVTDYAGTAALGGVPAASFELYRRLSEPVVREVVAAVTERGANAAEVRHWGGAIAAAGPDAGPVGHRDVPFSTTVDDPTAAAPLRPYATGGSFLNFLRDPARIQTAYTAADYERLRAVKRAHDPDNVFRHNHNVPPRRDPR